MVLIKQYAIITQQFGRWTKKATSILKNKPRSCLTIISSYDFGDGLL
jgi:hypothetical protein